MTARSIAGAIALAVCVQCGLTATPSFADDHRHGRWRHGDRHEWHDRGWHGSGYRGHGYYYVPEPEVYYYAPPPVYVPVPPPPSLGFNLIFPFRFD